MIVLGTGFGNGTITIALLLIIILFMLLFQRKYIFRGLAVMNKLIIPKLFKKDITKLKNYEKIILGYRYWVTKNSL
jgi:hypothetical protein